MIMNLKEKLKKKTVTIIADAEGTSSDANVDSNVQIDSKAEELPILNESKTELCLQIQKPEQEEITEQAGIILQAVSEEIGDEEQHEKSPEAEAKNIDSSESKRLGAWVFCSLAGALLGSLVCKLLLYIADHALNLGSATYDARMEVLFRSTGIVKLIFQLGSPIAGAILLPRFALGFTKSSTQNSFQALIVSELDRHKLPLIVLLSLLVFPKLIILWIPLALSWSGAEWLYPKLSLATRLRVQKMVPTKLRNSTLLREFSDGVAQAKPFIIFPLYIFCIPLALIWMSAHWLKKIAGLTKDEEQEALVHANAELFSFVQNRRHGDEESESNFFHSPAFALTCTALFGCGLPAFFTFMLYQQLGIDAMLGFPSADPQFKKVFFTIDLYIYSLGWCLSVLFLRAWFTFPLNFVGNECRIEMDSNSIRRRSNNWFTQILTFNSPYSGADSLSWTEIKCIRTAQHCPRLYPLPVKVLDPNSIVYKTINGLAKIVDSVTASDNFEEFLHIRTQEYGGSEFKIRLSELNNEDRARLYYAIRRWAPETAIGETVQEKMIGSTVLQAPRYTQMWFELLTEKLQSKRTGALPEAKTMQAGRFQIVNRLASGGQANIYLAKKTDDDSEVVLKEFILSNSDAVGSLLESAGEFETESTLLSQLKHPRIVKMLEFFAEDRRLYIVLEKVQGESLRQRVRRSKRLFSEQETVEIALQLCDAVAYLHELSPPVVHRDIAPDNIMYNDEDGIKLIDFSLAAANKSRRTTSTMGKHCYAPPEQFKEQACPQSDIYAIGSSMYFLLTGEDPKPITPSDLLSKNPKSSARLAEIILHATAFDLADRYADINWLTLELKALQSDLIKEASE